MIQAEFFQMRWFERCSFRAISLWVHQTPTAAYGWRVPRALWCSQSLVPGRWPFCSGGKEWGGAILSPVQLVVVGTSVVSGPARQCGVARNQY
ncbi:hypothetical protein GCM10022398_00570 [Acetobacter lovaniensis]